MSNKNNKTNNKKGKTTFPQNVFNYEVANFVSDSQDSIYALEFESRQGGAVYVSEGKIRDIVQDELAKRFGKNKGVDD